VGKVPADTIGGATEACELPTPKPGSVNDLVVAELLGISGEQIDALRQNETI
jgi:hypothetical protein